MSRPGSVLVLRALGLGDLLTGVPALRGLAGAFGPDALTLATPALLEPLARACAPLHAVLPTQGLAAPLGELGPEVAVNLHGSGPQSHRLLLGTKPGRLIAFHHPEVPESTAAPFWRPAEHEVARWCRLLRASGIEADPRDLALDPGKVPAVALPDGTTLLHPGASAPARQWPAERWAVVARAEARAGRPVLISAGPRERALAAQVAELAGLPATVVRSPADPLELAGVVAAAARLVCGDTGVAHLATALGRPSVVLFGPTPPALWGPPPGPRHLVLWKGHRGDPHGAEADRGLLEIQPNEVTDALGRLPGEAAAAR